MLEIKAKYNRVRVASTTVLEVTGGVEPYSIEVVSGGAGGLLTTKTTNEWYYSSPMIMPPNPMLAFDVVKVTDDNGEEATLRLDISLIEQLIAEVIQKGLGLADDQVVIGNERFDPPNDNRLYCTVLIADGKPISSSKRTVESNDKLYNKSYLVMRDMLVINLMSSNIKALNARHEIVMALQDDFATKMMEAYSFSIAKIPMNVSNVSSIEGAAIPYTFNISFAIQYAVERVKEIEYLNDFQQPDININK